MMCAEVLARNSNSRRVLDWTVLCTPAASLAKLHHGLPLGQTRILGRSSRWPTHRSKRCATWLLFRLSSLVVGQSTGSLSSRAQECRYAPISGSTSEGRLRTHGLIPTSSRHFESLSLSYTSTGPGAPSRSSEAHVHDVDVVLEELQGKC